MIMTTMAKSDNNNPPAVDTGKDDAGKDNAGKEQWLDKLWVCLFDGNSGGLISPGQIRRERRNRDQVRQLEMQAILRAEADINGIHDGTKSLDDSGNLVDTPTVEEISTHQVIENSAIEQGLDLGLETPDSMLRSVVREISVRDLERSLNIRKIAILSESEILAAESRPVSRQPINAEWLNRWRESAENVFHAEAQLLWARILVLELAQPGSYSLGSLTALRQLSHDDLQVLRIVGKYAFPAFIFDARGYFDNETHTPWFELMEDLGLMNHSCVVLDLKTQPTQDGALYLPCGNKAIRVSGIESLERVRLPIFKLTRIGRQLFPLVAQEADMAYLFKLAKLLREQGCGVELGDWLGAGADAFVGRMSL